MMPNMPNIMNGLMMGGMPMLWMLIGILLCLLLVVAGIWFVVHLFSKRRHSWMNAPSQPHDASYTYEQGYQPPEPSAETYQEGGQQYVYPQPPYKQPTQYPQEMH
jgi:flagellar basal body-associated protein FliL